MQNKELSSINYKLYDLHMQLGKEFSEIRHSRNEKQSTVARATGISPATLSKIETGHYIRLNTALITRLADYYNIEVQILLMKLPHNAGV